MKHTSSGSTNFSMYGAISTPNAIAVPARPMRPPLRMCKGFDGLLNMSTSWSTIWAILLWSPCWLHSRICLCHLAYKNIHYTCQSMKVPTSLAQVPPPSSSHTSCPLTASRCSSLQPSHTLTSCYIPGRTTCLPMVTLETGHVKELRFGLAQP